MAAGSGHRLGSNRRLGGDVGAHATATYLERLLDPTEIEFPFEETTLFKGLEETGELKAKAIKVDLEQFGAYGQDGKHE